MNFFDLKFGQRFRFVDDGPVYEKIGVTAFRFLDPPHTGPYFLHDLIPRVVLVETVESTS